MATPHKWSNVAVSMQSAITVGSAITAITKANPGVVSAATPPANGAYVITNAQGMTQVDGRVYRVIAAGAGVFSLEAEDTTLYDTFTSGTFQTVTLGTSITSATTVNASGGDFNFIDTTTIHQSVKTQIPGLANASTFDFDNIWDPQDPGLLALKAAADNQGTRAFKFTFGTGGPIMVFNGYVGATLLPGGQAQQLVTTKVVITMFGRPSYLPS